MKEPKEVINADQHHENHRHKKQGGGSFFIDAYGNAGTKLASQDAADDQQRRDKAVASEQ